MKKKAWRFTPNKNKKRKGVHSKNNKPQKKYRGQGS